MRTRSLLLLGAMVSSCAGMRLMAEEPAAPALDVHAELRRILLADAKNMPKADTPRASPAKAVAAPTAPVVLPVPLWNCFTDTGILASARGKKVTKELTFGPCTDGQLLNQRYFW